MQIDVAIVAGRRPDLLRGMLASFSEQVFRHFEIANVFVNLDPFMGTEEDGQACLELCHATFDSPQIRQPAEPSFGGAVKHLWSQAQSPVLLHLEDDWIANEAIRPEDVFPHLDQRCRAVVPVAQELNWDGKTLSETILAKRIKLFGLTVARRKMGLFGTSPRFLERDFARGCAALMDPTLDPEKQMRANGSNPAIVDYLMPYRSRLLPGKTDKILITDIGRAYREKAGLKKTVVGGVSVWSE